MKLAPLLLAAMLILSPTVFAAPKPAPPSAETSVERRDLAKRYSRGNYALYFAGEAWSFALLGIVVVSGLGVKFREWAQKAARGPNRVVFLTAAIFTVFVSLASLPLHIYRSYFREKRYGFAHQTVLGWLGDWGKGLGIGIVLGGLLFVALYTVVRKFPRRFWLIAAAVATLFTIMTVAVAPVFLAPLFNKFTSLPASPLKTRLLDLAHSQGIPATDIYEVDASRQSSHTNAYVAGLFGTERIVIYDTLLKNDTPNEVVAILGHEMGHYVLHHLWKGLALAALGIFVVCGLVRFLYPKVTHLEFSDPAGLPLVLLIVSACSFLSTPIGDGYSRRLEHEADAFGLDVARDPDAAESAFRKFNTIDLSEYDPPPFIELWYYTHPSLRHRIEFCELWKKTHATSAAVIAASKPSDWRPLDQANALYLELPSGRAVIELVPAFAPEHVANIEKLVRARYFDGLAFIRSQDNYVVQWGDPNADNRAAGGAGAKARPIAPAREKLPAEFTQADSRSIAFTPLAGPDGYAPEVGFSNGFPAARDPKSGRAWLAHCYGMVGVGRGDDPESGNGTEVYVVIGNAPRHLDRNTALVGRVVSGMEILSTLPRGAGPLGFYEKVEQRVPIRSIRLGSDMPPVERLNLEVFRTDTPAFAALVESRRNRRESWFATPAGYVELCNVPIPLRAAPSVDSPGAAR